MSSNDLTTKETIINATKQVLKQKGNATIKDIADAAFVNIAAINYHFGSKDNLITIVISEMVKGLRDEVAKLIHKRVETKDDFDILMTNLVNVVFQFAEENIGIVSYSFVQIATEPTTSNVLVEFFLQDEEFLSLIINSLQSIFPDASYETLFAKYLVLFSSFVVPFFLNFSITTQNTNIPKSELAKYVDQFKGAYIAELRSFLTI
ncbi:MAG: TetR/AcrR family transcriptional regulator [Acholeplasmataceae bacterium]|jgi:AcrR family transcriptional regulator